MHAGRPIGREDVLLIIDGWVSSSCRVQCSAEIGPSAFNCVGRVVEFSDRRRVRFLSDDKLSEFVFDFMDYLAPQYTDPRDFPESPMVCALVFMFPKADPSAASQQSFISLAELPSDS